MAEELGELALEECRDKMHKAVTHLRGELATVRTGRATPSLVEKLVVDYYGTDVVLQQLAGITVPEPRSLLVTPYDRNAISSIEKAIQASDLGINPGNDGQAIRLAFPPLTEDRRKDLVKVVRHRAEDGRVAVRNIRRQARHDVEALEHDGELSEDELNRVEKSLQKLTDEVIAEIGTLVERKERELLED